MYLGMCLQHRKTNLFLSMLSNLNESDKYIQNMCVCSLALSVILLILVTCVSTIVILY